MSLLQSDNSKVSIIIWKKTTRYLILAHTRALRRINAFLNIIVKSSIEVIIEINLSIFIITWKK